MKESFLRQVAGHYYRQGGFENSLFIFPNRRSMTFFRKHLGDISRENGKAFLLPRLTTVSDFYAVASGETPSDRITLLLKLYECYRKLNAKAEPLDDFIYWGDVLLADFDDIDKYMVDARMLFSNISDIKDIEDDYSYATEEQKKAIDKLWAHFGGNWSIETASDRDARRNFLSIWKILYPLYSMFREELSASGSAYGGMIYRTMAESISDGGVADLLAEAFPGIGRFVFVGLNILSESERRTMRKMQEAQLAEFCWDFCGPVLTDGGNTLFRFMRDNVATFGNAFVPVVEPGSMPEVHSVSVPSATGQAKLLPDIIEEVPQHERGLDFAVVTADESMLGAVLSGIPGSIKTVNVTMGYPMSASEWGALMKDILALQMHLRFKDGQCFFYHRQVYDILSSGIIKGLLDEARMKTVDSIYKDAKYYIPQCDFSDGGILSEIFRPVVTSSEADASQIEDLARYQLDTITSIVALLGEENDFLKDFAMQYYLCVNRLKGLGLAIRPRTWAHLLDRLAAGISVPFEGEPLEGLQVMGPLETRALDFKHIVIMNANEGVFPRRSSSPSFVPPEMRTAFGLPTYDRQDAVWAYYFYRLINRAENVWMLHDSRAGGLVTGEESRFIKQLKYLYPNACRLDFSIARAQIDSAMDDSAIEKTKEHVDKLAEQRFSASAIENYMSCQVKFYYHTVEHLYPKEDVKESLDAGLMGTVCHDTLEALYTSSSAMLSDEDFDKRDKENKNKPIQPYELSLDYLESWLQRPQAIRRKIDAVICNKLRCIEVSGSDVITADVAESFVMQVLRSDVEYLKRQGKDRMTVIALEHEFDGTIAGHRFHGYVDRLDSMDDGTLRVVDYKTGSDRPDVLGEGTDPKKIFGTDSYRTKAAFQFFIYDRLIQQSTELPEEYKNAKLVNSMYALNDFFINEVKRYDVRPDFMDGVEEELKGRFAEIEDISKPWERAAEKNCRFCDYKSLCGRVERQ